MIPIERVVVVVVVIASRPFASRPSRSRRSLDRRSSVDATSDGSQTSSTRRAVASTIDDRIESNRPRRVRAVGRSVGRSMLASSKNKSTRRRSIFVSIDASSIVSNRRRRSTRASHREGDHRASRPNPRRRRRPARRGFADARARWRRKTSRRG